MLRVSTKAARRLGLNERSARQPELLVEILGQGGSAYANGQQPLARQDVEFAAVTRAGGAEGSRVL